MKLENLKGIIPDNVLSEIPIIMTKFNINTSLRLAHFLAQAAHESGDFKVVTENLNYSADRLKIIFPKYFNTVDVNLYNRNPEKIANRVYASRMGNGNEGSGDGYKFRGRGYIQLTGKQNYTLFDDFVEEYIVGNPDLVATKYPLLSAAWFFSKTGINAIADLGSSMDVITKVTKKVNGGVIGLDDRAAKFNKFYPILIKD
jgi:putative chitinase